MLQVRFFYENCEGKTTSSASIATCFAQRRNFNRILLISTDPAHSLGDAFQMDFVPGIDFFVPDGLRARY